MADAERRPELNRHGLITGATSGLGLAVARVAARLGMRLTLVGRDPERLDAASRQLSEKCPGSIGGQIVADLSIRGEPARVVRQAAEDQPLDFVCHAAGLSMRGTIADTSRDDFERTMAINFFAAAEIAAALGQPFGERGGRLVLIGSLATRVAPAYLGAYPASKHPLAALAQQLRLEQGAAGLRVLLVLPGPIARDDAGARYDAQAEGLPDVARKPGGGARVRAIDPEWLAERVLDYSRRGRAELVLPRKARLLFAVSQIWPSLGDRLLRRSMRGD